MSSSEEFSIVDYYSDNEGYRCGYCKSPNTNRSHGMWAHSLSVQDYQDLIDRGWRRSGSYCYKPTMHLTCCPMYTIKCSVLDFKLSKSQKKKLKRFNKFLAQGIRNASAGDNDTNESTSDCGDGIGNDCSIINELPGMKEKSEKAQVNYASTIVNTVAESLKERDPVSSVINTAPALSTSDAVSCSASTEGEAAFKTPSKKIARPGDGMDPNRPQCKKAKLLRLERKEKKLAQLGSCATHLDNTKVASVAKSLENFLNEPLPESPAHRLEIKLVSVESAEMEQSFDISHKLFAKYQMAIHKEKSDECDKQTFDDFLVTTPLKPWRPHNGPPQGYGSFHQQYWLDGRLIAVGVIDILPSCVSSVYFFYDPEFHSLVLGTYGSLREIAFCRLLHHSAPSIRFYYMGFYIHSCPKMRYKGAYSPSFLLCPEVYTWHPIESCIPLLERNKYSRFNQDPQAKDSDLPVTVHKVCILFHNEAMTYQRFLSFKLSFKNIEEVSEYASLVGDKLSKRMLLLIME